MRSNNVTGSATKAALKQDIQDAIFDVVNAYEEAEYEAYEEATGGIARIVNQYGADAVIEAAGEGLLTSNTTVRDIALSMKG